MKGIILAWQARYPEAVAEHERALALDPSNVYAAADLGWDYARFGEADKSLEYFDKAIRASPHDPVRAHFYGGRAVANFGLKRYDQAIDAARQGIAILISTSDYEEVVQVADRALVLARGRIVASLDGDEITTSKLLAAAGG